MQINKELSLKSFRVMTANVLNSNGFFIVFLVALLALTASLGGAGYFLGIFVALATLWANRWDWAIFNFGRINLFRTLTLAVAYALGFVLVIDIIIQPLVEIFFGKIQLESFEGLKGNWGNYLLFIGFMWIVAAFGEEILYRGLIMKRFAEILGGRNEAWFLAAAINGLFFGLAHLYQGLTGVITTGLFGFIIGLIFMRNRNLFLPILIHGIYDMIGITLIFLDMETFLPGLLNI